MKLFYCEFWAFFDYGMELYSYKQQTTQQHYIVLFWI